MEPEQPALQGMKCSRASSLIVVDEISHKMLDFWVAGLGFTCTASVSHPPNARPEDGAPFGFVMLSRDDVAVSVMYQSTASIAVDVPGAIVAPTQNASIYIRLTGLDALRAHLKRPDIAKLLDVVVADRVTFYGARETFVRAPCGTLVAVSEFPSPAPGPSAPVAEAETPATKREEGEPAHAARKRAAVGEEPSVDARESNMGGTAAAAAATLQTQTPMSAEAVNQLPMHFASYLLLVVGARTGLLDAMATLTSPEPAGRIADVASLHPRYVREWLGGMTTANLVLATLRPKKARTDSEGRDGTAQHIAVANTLYELAPAVKDNLTTCAGAMDQSVFFDFFMTIAQEGLDVTRMGARFKRTNLVDVISKRTPPPPSTASHATMHAALSSGGCHVADIGCGGGVGVHVLASAFPSSSFLGVDIQADAVADAAAEAKRLCLSNATFKTLDASTLGSEPSLHGKFDWIMAVDSIHDMAKPEETLAGIFACLKPGGVFSMLDINGESRHVDNIGSPAAAVMYTISMLHCTTVSLAGKGPGLGAMWGRQVAVSYLAKAGFDTSQLKMVPPPPGSNNLHYWVPKPL